LSPLGSYYHTQLSLFLRTFSGSHLATKNTPGSGRWPVSCTEPPWDVWCPLASMDTPNWNT
jgi:hypothetical protein